MTIGEACGARLQRCEVPACLERNSGHQRGAHSGLPNLLAGNEEHRHQRERKSQRFLKKVECVSLEPPYLATDSDVLEKSGCVLEGHLPPDLDCKGALCNRLMFGKTH